MNSRFHFPLARINGSSPSSITPSAYLPQPHGKTALVSGLNYISRIFALLGEILVRIRVDKRSPPQGQFATARLEEVQSLHGRISAALSHAPDPLRLKASHTPSHMQPEFGGAGFRQASLAEVKDFFDNPNASRANALNPFLVMQANLYVTQVRVWSHRHCGSFADHGNSNSSASLSSNIATSLLPRYKARSMSARWRRIERRWRAIC